MPHLVDVTGGLQSPTLSFGLCKLTKNNIETAHSTYCSAFSQYLNTEYLNIRNNTHHCTTCMDISHRVELLVKIKAYLLHLIQIRIMYKISVIICCWPLV